MAKILIIEDDVNCREMLRTRLKKLHHEILESEDGESGIDLTQRNIPDLVILDIRLPKVDGFEVCRRLRTNPKTLTIPIIMLTGCSQDVQGWYGLKCGADEYIVKPWEWDVLLKCIDKMLAVRHSANVFHAPETRQQIKEFIRDLVQWAQRIPKTDSGQIMGAQITRYGTSAIAHYENSLHMDTQTHFIQEIHSVKSDLDDIVYWLGLVIDSKALPAADVGAYHQRAKTLAELFSQRHKT